jgi:hypothetical protein
MSTKVATYKITLPESGENLGKWLEQNNARLEITCSLGKYCVSVRKHYPGSYTEERNTSVQRSSTVTVNAYGDMFSTTLSEAMRLANEVKP